MRKSEKEADWSSSLFLTSVAAAVFGAFYLTNDTFIMHQVILFEDQFTAVSVYLILGGWIGTFCTPFYNAVFGKWLDKNYPGFTLGTLKMQRFALLSGFIAAGSTTFCLMANQILDPSLVTALANLALLYLVIFEGVRGSISLKKLWLPALLVIGGSVLASLIRIEGGFEITFLGILILLVGRCGTDAVEKIVRQHGGWKTDAVTFNFWRFFWLTVSGTLLAFGIALARGTLSELVRLLKTVLKPAFPWVILTMFFVFFFNTLLQKAMKLGAVSKVSMVANLQIVLGIPLTLAADRLWPSVFGEIPSDPRVWLLRLIGVALIVLGIIPLAREEESLKRKQAAS